LAALWFLIPLSYAALAAFVAAAVWDIIALRRVGSSAAPT
jgi:hypothetical protein